MYYVVKDAYLKKNKKERETQKLRCLSHKKKEKRKSSKKYKLSWKKLSYFKDLLHELNNRIDEEIYKKKWLK